MNLIWKNIVNKFAPVLGMALLGPLEKCATKFIADKFLKNPNATKNEIATALESADSDQLILLKELDHDFKKIMEELNINVSHISAKKKQMQQKENDLSDGTPSLLACMVTIGFFGILSIIIFVPIQDSAKQLVDILLGSLGSVWVTAMAYYFGSSHGSAMKNYWINDHK